MNDRKKEQEKYWSHPQNKSSRKEIQGRKSVVERIKGLC